MNPAIGGRADRDRHASRPPRRPPGLRAGAALVACALGVLGAGPRGGPEIRWRTIDDRQVVEVSGIDEAILRRLDRAGPGESGWPAILRVGVSDDGSPPGPDRAALLGDYRLEDGLLRFVPRFPLEPGLTFVAVFDPSKLPGADGGKPLVASLTVERRAPGPEAEIDRVDPAGDVLPENQLRFYLHFSAPMSRGEAYERVRILDGDGRAVDLPFLELDEELWDPDARRLTLLIDPGRIKSGLRPREESGPVFEAGKSYTLVVDREWPAADGRPLRAGVRKAFRAGPPDNAQPDPSKWAIRPPASGTREPLVVEFGEPLDRPQAERLVRVVDGGGAAVPGEVRLTHADTRYRLEPARPWAPGTYGLVVGTTLEDLAGNSVERPFEVDLFRVDDGGPRREGSVRRAFRIGAE